MTAPLTMEEDSSLALVPSSHRVIISGPHRHSFPNLPNDVTFVFNEATHNIEREIMPTPNGRPEAKPRFTWEALSSIVSMLYCYILVVLGVALPVTQTITKMVPSNIYDLFYIYLYGGSLLFVISLNIVSIKRNAERKRRQSLGAVVLESHGNPSTHGSFYLRLGASIFGIGAMVYSGLEFGEHFLTEGGKCQGGIISALKPALRMLFTLLQIQFIFLSEYSVHCARYSSLMRISLAHMLATNLAEWLSVVVEETKHEIHHIHPHSFHHGHGNQTNKSLCEESDSGVLVAGVTAYLFPCSIEYSLICAVTLIEMWKEIRIDKKEVKKEETTVKELPVRKGRSQQYSVDCTHSEKGLCIGLVSTVYTLISLIAFFSLRDTQEEAAYWNLTVCETILYVASLIAMAIASQEMRNLAYCVHRIDSKGSLKLGLDISLLLKAQIGVYMYCMFSLIACLFTPEASSWPDILTIFQTSVQTIFIIDTWWKRCATPQDQDKKPGRQCLTFLRLVNVSLWIVTITEKNRAELKPIQLAFYGMWPWTIITHVSMPLHVFYRFHSSICFFEIWRNSYKGIHVAPDAKPMF